MQFPDSYFQDEVRNGFYVPALMKRSWAAQMEVLADIARVCEKYGIRWFAHGGTLLGAVRHGGFIPWDDDLDICMFREDYVRFNAIAEKELPRGYYIPRDRGDNYRLLITVCSGTPVCLETGHLEKFHQFPFSTGIDIFALDYVAPDPEEEELHRNLASIVWSAATLVNEENRNTPESLASVAKVQEFLHVTFDQDRPLKEQLFALLEQVFSMYTREEARELTFMPYLLKNPSYRFPAECYQKTVLLPFESGTIPAPCLYDPVLKAEYGDYMKPCRSGGDHSYPFFQSLEEHLAAQEAVSRHILPRYRFSPGDLIRKRSDEIRPLKLTRDFVRLAGRIHKNIFCTLSSRQTEPAQKLLEACQNSAIRVGTMLEQALGETSASGTVMLLEQYCELVYQLHESLPGQFPETSAASILRQMDDLLVSIQNRIWDSMAARIPGNRM